MHTRNSKIDETRFQEELPAIYRSTLKGLKEILQSYIFFHGSFLFLLLLEISVLLYAIHDPPAIAAALGALLVTGFSYLILHLYFQTKKTEKLQKLNQRLLYACKKAQYPLFEKEHHLSTAATFIRLSSYLQDFEKNFYKTPSWLYRLQPLCNSFSTHCHRRDVFQFKQILLESAVEEYVKQIQSFPTDLAVHVSLASAYIEQAGLLRSALPYVSKKTQGEWEAKANLLSHLAIEEFQILNEYAPNDPWVHEQLIEGYRILRRPEEELKEMEILVRLKSEDLHALFRLGELYFRQGMKAKGLKIYEQLKNSGYDRTKDLLASYNIFKDW